MFCWPCSATTPFDSACGSAQGRLYGEVRWSEGTLPTDFTFTLRLRSGQAGQRVEAGLGLLDYRARYYDPVLGRFVSADTIVPEAGNPQDLNRYAYVRNNPLRYIDPSGHFPPEQLASWLGKNWRDVYNEGWRDLLLTAEFGDAVMYGSTIGVFVESEGSLMCWDVNSRSARPVHEFATGTGELALYRPRNANQAGGPTKNDAIIQFGELTDLHAALAYSLNIYNRIMGDPNNTSRTLTLPLDWYIGSNSHVDVHQRFAGFKVNMLNVASLGLKALSVKAAVETAGKITGSAILQGLGGWAQGVLVALQVASWTTWDTDYIVRPGPGTPPILPIPTPRPQGTFAP